MCGLEGIFADQKQGKEQERQIIPTRDGVLEGKRELRRDEGLFYRGREQNMLKRELSTKGGIAQKRQHISC